MNFMVPPGNAAASRKNHSVCDSGARRNPPFGAQPVAARGNLAGEYRDEMRIPGDLWFSLEIDSALHVCVVFNPGRARGAVFSGSRGGCQDPSRLGKHSIFLNPSADPRQAPGTHWKSTLYFVLPSELESGRPGGTVFLGIPWGRPGSLWTGKT